jgi:Holliday junction DNA helicase RuvA
MIHHIRGTVEQTAAGMAVIESNGIGYEVFIPDGSPLFLSEGTGEEVVVYTAMIVREDDVSLYGFADRESLAMFRLLMTVSGVGAKAALAILSALPVGELARAIASEDSASITKANGVGKKTAQRVVIDLRDKVQGFAMAAAPVKKKTPERNENRDIAVSALISMGLTRTEALSALDTVKEEDLSPEEYIMRALRAR